MGVTSSFLNKKQRASNGNSTSSENRNKGSMGMYGGNGDDESQQGDGASSSGTTPSQTTTTTPTPEQGGTTTQGSPIITEQRTRLTGANDATKSMLASQGEKSKVEGNGIPIPDRVSYATLGDIVSEMEKLGIKLPKKDEEAERKRKLRASLSDGLSALASAFFVNAGGLPTYDPKDNAYNKVLADIKEGDANREKQRAEWLALMERAVARNRAEVDALNAHNLATYKAQVDENRYKEGMDLKRKELEELIIQNKFNRELKTKEFDHKKYVDEKTLKINLAKVTQAAVDAGKSKANAQRYKIAVSKAWAKLAAMAKEKDDEGKLKYPDLEAQMKAVGNPVYDSKKRNLIGHYAPTTDQQLSLIMQIGEAQQVFDDYWEGYVDDGEFNREDYLVK